MKLIAPNRLLCCCLLLWWITTKSFAVGTLEFSAAMYRVNERSGKAVLTVNRSGGSAGAASVDFETSPWAASADRDYVSSNGTLSWVDGDASAKTIEIQIIKDAFEEEPQNFFVTLSNPSGAVIGEKGITEVIILDPSVRFEELYGSAYPATSSLDLLVSVSGIAATKIEYLEGDTLLGVSNAPRPDGNFLFVWNNVPRGNYTLRARATDAEGFTFTSPSRTLLISGPVAGAGLAVAHVDSNNKTGIENGAEDRPFSTIQKGIDNTASGGVVKVASGTYRESILIDNTVLQVLGGYVGARAEDYASGLAGDFSTRTGAGRRVNVQPTAGRAGFGLYNAQDSQVDGFAISGGSRGVFIVGDTPAQSFPKLRHNLITRNGEAYRSHGGGGVHAENSSLELVGNEISFNIGGRGAGVGAGGIQASIVMRENTVLGNVAYDDHGGGLYIMANGVIAGNLIQDNEVGKGVEYGGWGGGLILFGNSNDFFPQVALSNNVVVGNLAGDGSAEFFDEGVHATLDHELIYGNRAPADGGGAIYVDGCCDTTIVVNHCTVVDNEGYRPGGNGLNTDTLSSAEVSNSIFWNNGSGDFSAVRDSTLLIKYTLSGDTITTSEGMVAGPGNIRSDPLFADAARHDYHLKSTRGRWRPAALGNPGAWVRDDVNSPAMDAGDPAADFSWEALPAGGRTDLGIYGNQSDAGLNATMAGAKVKIVVNGMNGRPYKLERGDNLETWSEIATLTTVTGQAEYLDDVGSGPRFYRVRQ